MALSNQSHGTTFASVDEDSRPVVSARRSTIAASFGNILEWYDFAIYSFFAVLIGQRFFPAGDATAALLSSFAVFGVGYVVRPLGGILIGRFGDRHGRRPALMLTMGLMAAGTLLIALIPSYAYIGVFAPLLLLLSRLLQGFSAGGEWGTAASYLVEWAPAGRRGYVGSFQQSTATIGLLAGSGVSAMLASLLTPAAVEAWGWRVPFLIGALLGPIGLVLRRSVGETPAFARAERQAASPGQWRPALRLFSLVAMPYAVTLTFMFYYPTFTQKYAGLSRSESLWSNTIALIVLVVLIPVAGRISDRVGRKPMLVIGNAAFLLLSYPMLKITLAHPTLATVMSVQAGFSLFYAIYTGAAVAAYVELFSTRTRMSWLSGAYNLSGIVFGGFAGYIATWLIAKTGSPISIVYLVLVSTVVTGAGLIGMRETAFTPLR